MLYNVFGNFNLTYCTVCHSHGRLAVLLRDHKCIIYIYIYFIYIYIMQRCDPLQVDISKVVTLCKLLESLLLRPGGPDLKQDVNKLNILLCTTFIFCYLWAIGGNLIDMQWDAFDSFIRREFEDNPDAKVGVACRAVSSPLDRSECFTLHPPPHLPRQTCSFQHQLRFSGKHFRQAAIMRNDYSLKFPPPSTVRYSFIQLSELGHHGENEDAKISKQSQREDSNPDSLDCGVLLLSCRTPQCRRFE